jgi:hypothetical protein
VEARRIAVKAVHMIAHTALGMHAESAPNQVCELLRPREVLHAPSHVRERTALPGKAAFFLRDDTIGRTPSLGAGTALKPARRR